MDNFTSVHTFLTRYKIEIEVEYEGKIGCFVFWDKECIQYVGLYVHDLREVLKKVRTLPFF